MMQAAVLTYGVLTIVLAFALAWSVGSFWGMATAAAAAGLTYVFQVVADAITSDRLLTTFVGKWLYVLWAAIILAILASFALSILAAGF